MFEDENKVTLFDTTADPPASEVGLSLSTLEASLNCFDDTVASTIDTRRKLLAKALPAVMALDLTVDHKTDPEIINAKARLFSEARQLLNDMDSSMYRHASFKQKKENVENAHQSTVDTIEILRSIKLNQDGFGNTGSYVANDANLEVTEEKMFTERGLAIECDDELEMGSNMLPIIEDNEAGY